MSRRKCYLCGGKLEDGRCKDCGLDNARADKKTYRLNHSNLEHKMKSRKETEDSWDRARKNTKAAKDENSREYDSYGWQKQENMEFHKTSGGIDSRSAHYAANKKSQPQGRDKKGGFTVNSKKTANWKPKGKSASGQKKKSVKAAGVIIAVGVALIGPISNFISDYKYKNIETQTVDSLAVETDAYQYAPRKLSAVGEDFTQELEQGEYKVGVHIPEGNYQVILVGGSGDVTIDDGENSIYEWRSMGEDVENGELHEWNDVRLYQGAVLEIQGNLRVRMATDCAQNSKMIEMLQNPLSEEKVIKAGEEYVAGEGFPEGVYDLSLADSWSGIFITIPLHTNYEEEEWNNLNKNIWLSREENHVEYRNLVLPAGTVICSDYADVKLVPSKMIETEDYGSYYDRYRY